MSEREELLDILRLFKEDYLSADEALAGLTDAAGLAQGRQEPTRECCILCANGNDLPEGEQCAGCGREGHAVGLRAAVIKARGRAEPPSTPVHFAQGPTEPLQCLRCGTVDAFGPASKGRTPPSAKPMASPMRDDLQVVGPEGENGEAFKDMSAHIWAAGASLEDADFITRMLARKGLYLFQTEPWKRCPSTHCERRAECGAARDCTVKTPSVPSTDKAPEGRPHPEVVAAVQEALMRHPHWNPGLGSSAFAFGLANTAIDAYRTAMTSKMHSGDGR